MSTGTMATGWYFSKWGAPAAQQTGPLTWQQLYSYAQSDPTLTAVGALDHLQSGE